VEIPVVAIVDIDILSDRDKFLLLFEAMGGKPAEVDQDVQTIIRLVRERKGQMTGTELAVELKRLAAEAQVTQQVPRQIRTKLLELGREASNWQRVKHDGFRALDAKTFHRIFEASIRLGLLINPEGELEGFCREISRTRKAEWLAEAIRRDLNRDPSLADARKFATQIRTSLQTVLSSTI
jgi:hypothetical protein